MLLINVIFGAYFGRLCFLGVFFGVGGVPFSCRQQRNNAMIFICGQCLKNSRKRLIIKHKSMKKFSFYQTF
jgi:hypothetical protein